MAILIAESSKNEMTRITRPPDIKGIEPWKSLAGCDPDQVEQYAALFSPLDKKGRYLHYDELQYRLDKGIDHKIAWSLIKNARQLQQQYVIELGKPSFWSSFFLTPTIQKAISVTDRKATDISFEAVSRDLGEKVIAEYLLRDLITDEAISSSQLEGAATTTKVAKDILRTQRAPRTTDEKMILGNFKMMLFAWKNRRKQLSLDLIQELHHIGTEMMDANRYGPGRLRHDEDNVAVVDMDDNILHTPPPAHGLKDRLNKLVEWVNSPHHEIDSEADSNCNYLHPLIKAIILHFSIGYEHPFLDGNGRAARALFYWYMFKNGYSVFRNISISVLLKKAPAQYMKGYLYTETDEMDLTYFIEQQCRTVIQGIQNWETSYKKLISEKEEFEKFLWDSKLYSKMSDKQRIVFQVARRGGVQHFTISNVEENLGCSYNTASKVLKGLVKLDLFDQRKNPDGRGWIFSMRSKENIKEAWT